MTDERFCLLRNRRDETGGVWDILALDRNRFSGEGITLIASSKCKKNGQDRISPGHFLVLFDKEFLNEIHIISRVPRLRASLKAWRVMEFAF